ncbi:phosphoribosyltransferase-like protein [Dipodascopsis tothii]|uniref:phosphoribosyltransferase-like protein n=1 Tax=Dipodascopsis tothii TaxID=44089 RepID=UPI0034CE28E2
MTDKKTQLIELSYENKILSFGDYTLKSGRKSPYFFNSGLYTSAAALSSVAASFAEMIHNSPEYEFDVVFGPAYKGISLAAITLVKLVELDAAKYGKVEFAYNRKEKKDHGEGGMTVGAKLEGKRVLILDDVMTAGTAIKESMAIIAAENAVLAGVALILDRKERMVEHDYSMIDHVKKEYGVPVKAVINVFDILSYFRGKLDDELIARMEAYLAQYAVKA